jgi:hypothetical protein
MPVRASFRSAGGVLEGRDVAASYLLSRSNNPLIFLS